MKRLMQWSGSKKNFIPWLCVFCLPSLSWASVIVNESGNSIFPSNSSRNLPVSAAEEPVESPAESSSGELAQGCVEPASVRPVNLEASTSRLENLAAECPTNDMFNRVSTEDMEGNLSDPMNSNLVAPGSNERDGYTRRGTME